jgi:F-type H+-transporting ATPase subunit epsilon
VTTFQVEFLVPEGELWSGKAELVIAKTLDGDIGVKAGHSPVLGILAQGSVVTIRPEPGAEGSEDRSDVLAAVAGGFFSVADDRVSILARQGQLGRDVDAAAARAGLDTALQDAAASADSDGEPAEVRYLRALLRAAGESDDRA